MYMSKEDWEKLKKYAQEITTYDLMKTEVDGLKVRIRDLEDEVSHIGNWIENHDWEEADEKVSDMFENSINKDDTTKPETIMEHFQKILPYGDFENYKLCPSHFDVRIKDFCDDPFTHPVCDVCWNRIYCDDIMKDEKYEIDADETPIVDAEPIRHGYWEFHAKSIKDVPTESCSECGEWSYGDNKAYCPCCGARMDGIEDE